MIEDREERKRRFAAARQARYRLRKGAQPHSQSFQRTKPWEVEGCSQRTWYRRRRTERLATGESTPTPLTLSQRALPQSVCTNVIEAMLSDKCLLASDFRVGVALISHLGSATTSAFPSHEKLAELTHMSVRNVINCLERLRDAGWIRWERANRQEVNQYELGIEAANVLSDSHPLRDGGGAA